MALGYSCGFITSKHRQLMGWFNKKFINEEKQFSNKMYQIYKTAYDNRQDSDYNLVIVNDSVEPMVVVTVYKTSKVDKYWRES